MDLFYLYMQIILILTMGQEIFGLTSVEMEMMEQFMAQHLMHLIKFLILMVSTIRLIFLQL